MREGTGKLPTIGVLAGLQVYYGTILGNFIGPLLHGVYSAAEHRGCNLLVAGGMDASSYIEAHPAWPVPSTDVDFIPIGPWNTDGLIVVNPLFSELRSQYIQSVIAQGHPVVFIATGETGPTVAIDNPGAIRQALVHLMDHGHQRIAFIAGYPNDLNGDSGVRLKAFQHAVQELGLASDQNLIAYGSHGIDGGQQAMHQILRSGASFTAVLASNDESAIGAMNALNSTGFRIPQDVAIIGIDDTFEAITQQPPLTTFHSSPFRMGYQALELLLDHIEGRRERLENITVPMQFVIRQSCGCQRGVIPHIITSMTQASSLPKSEASITAQLTRFMSEIALTGTQRLSPGEIQSRCRQLVESFIENLRSKKSVGFRLSLEETLLRVESLEDDMHIWDSILSVLEGGLGPIREMLDFPPQDQYPESLVAEARSIISQNMDRHHRHVIIRQKWITDQMGQLNARLLTALDEAQIYGILEKHLPQIGIRQMGVAFFEPEADDPVAWCSLRKVSGYGEETRFPSRRFPPTVLYQEPYRLALLPMVGSDEAPGFVAFDAADLEICSQIVWQLVTFLKVVRLYREATHGRQLAEEANRLKSRFLSTVSHELRTPLNLIVGLSEIQLQKWNHNETEGGQDLKRIHASAQHLDGLIRDVLDLAQNDMGELKLFRVPLDLKDTLDVIAAVGEQLVQDKGLEWQVSIPQHLPTVWGDRTRIRQITLNLINNAVKFTTQGKVELHVSANDDYIIIDVSDTGLGILAEEQTFIFDEFRQSERTTTLGYGGLGLGLAICKRLVELHGGSISVRSSGQEGAGSTFSFTLPVMKPNAGWTLPKTIHHDRPVVILADRTGSGKRLQQHLLQQGFDVELAWLDGREHQMHTLLDLQPGVVLLEQGPTLEQGWNAIKAWRENPKTRSIPVLLFTLDEKEDNGSFLELNYLIKPLERTEFIKALERQKIRTGMNSSTILIVDDEPSTVELHTRMIAAWSPSCRILKARNGKEALESIQATHPDLVLLDLMMPEMDGFGVLQAMHSNPHTRDIPVIVLTGQTLSLEDMTRLGKGVTSVLKKGLLTSRETLSHIEAALSHTSTLGNDARRSVRRAMVYLHDHYMEPISLEETARHVNMSKEYLARCFRQEMGVTLVTYLNRYRVDHAKGLLEEGKHNLTEVAFKSGFSSSAYFSRVFKHEVGMKPSDYIKMMNP